MENDSRRYLEGAFVTALSILALGVSGYSTYWQRQQARAMVLPRLQLSTWFDDGQVRVMLENVGVGPADIRGVAVTYEGKVIKDWPQFLKVIDAFKDVEHPSMNQGSVHGRVLGAGRDVKVLELTNLIAAARVRAALPKISVEICYCSVLDECWLLTDAETTRHEPISSCASVPNTFEN